MQDHAIRIESLSKAYQIYARPQDRLKQAVLPRLQRLVPARQKRYYQEFWALSDVSFEVARGSTVGIIGRNGSGKSTLLQIVCGTLSPTGGRVQVKGRVAALLELGSGFNSDFTGRENVFLNAMVLGLERHEVDSRFDSIAAFADIGDFIDQPVKTYSSGMIVRLAFAVIAHVDADILVIDEALAVGDAVFSQKCMRFLRRFKENGTVLFVSHDAASVVSLCSEAVWLDQGRVRLRGPAKDVAEAYAQYCAQLIVGESQSLESLRDKPDGEGSAGSVTVEEDVRIDFFANIADAEGWTTGCARIESVAFARVDGEQIASFAGGEKVVLNISARTSVPMQSPIIGFFVKDRLGQALFGHNTFVEGRQSPAPSESIIQARFVFNLPMLPNGEYSMTVAIADGDLGDHVQHHWMHDAVILAVSSSMKRYGLVGIPFESIHLSVTPGSETSD